MDPTPPARPPVPGRPKPINRPSPERRTSPTSPPGTPTSSGLNFSRSPRPGSRSPRIPGSQSPSPPSVSPRAGASSVPPAAFSEVARRARGAKVGDGSVLTDDALLAGWLQVKAKDQWLPRFFQLRSGSLTSYGCAGHRKMTISAQTSVKLSPIAESASRWLRADVNTTVTISDPQLYKLAEPTLFCTAAQAHLLQQCVEDDGAASVARIIICFRPDVSGGAPVHKVLRVERQSIDLYDLQDALEYTLMGLTLEATDEPVNDDFPFGLIVSSAVSDQMFLPLKDMLLAAQTPLIILQWMGALQSADLDPPPQPTAPRTTLASTGTRSGRSASGALLGQLVSNAVGGSRKGSGGFGELSDFTSGKSNEVKRRALEDQLAALPWDPEKPLSVQEAIVQPAFAECLSEFCKTIFTEENVNFCIEVHKFQSNRDARVRQAEARTIASEYISYSGKSVVNISSVTRKRVEDILSAGIPIPTNIFDGALDEVMHLIEADSWPKFLTKLDEVREEVALNQGEHSWESGDSSSYEERERKSDRNDFGGDSLDVDQAGELQQVRVQVAKSPLFNPDELPSLKWLLAKKDSRQIMKAFARTILAEENVMFWEDAQRFKANEAFNERKALLENIFTSYINPNSKTVLNIAGAERGRLLKLYEEQGEKLASAKDVFDLALVECIKVMELDLYPKFINLVKEVHPRNVKKEPTRSRAPPLWEILNDPEELSMLLLFAAGNNQQDDILFWCLVQRFRVEADPDTRNRLGSYIMQNYVCANAPRMIRVDKSKKSACQDRFLELVAKKQNLPADLYDALWRDVQSSMNKHLHPAYDKSIRKPKKGTARPSSVAGGQMLEMELTEAMKEDDLMTMAPPQPRGWVPVKSTPSQEPGAKGTLKKNLLGGRRRKKE